MKVYAVRISIIENNKCVKVLSLSLNCEYNEIRGEVANILNTKYKDEIRFAQSIDCEIL